MADSLDDTAYAIAAKDVIWPWLPVLVVDVDTRLILFCSEPAARMLGYDRHALSGVHMSEVLAEGAPPLPPGESCVQLRRVDGAPFQACVIVAETNTMDKTVKVVLLTDLS